MESISELAAKLKVDVSGWEGVIFHWACSLACKVAEELLEGVDAELMKGRDEGLKSEGMKEHLVVTVFGDVRIKRRLYRDDQGKYRFLLDERMGLDKRCHVGPKVKELATLLSSQFPFQKSEEILRAIMPSAISHTTIHRLVARLTEPYLEAEDKELEEVYEGGVIPESEGRVVPYLFVEADGTNIALQRENRRRAEVKVGIAYEGWKETGKGHYRLQAKSSYSGLMNGDRFWEGFSLILAKKYDLSQVGKVIVGGDGAGWVKEGAELLGGIYQLDRFHLKRALNQALDQEAALEVYQACTRGDLARSYWLLREAQGHAGEDKAEEIARLGGYLWENALGLRDYRLEIGDPNLRGVGSIEGNVDKLVANRMKKRGMSWSVKGAQRMAKLISLRETGKLRSWVPHRIEISYKTDKTISAQKSSRKDDGAWLRAGLPALYGPQDRPWIKVLRELSRGVYPGFLPTNS